MSSKKYALFLCFLAGVAPIRVARGVPVFKETVETMDDNGVPGFKETRDVVGKALPTAGKFNFIIGLGLLPAAESENKKEVTLEEATGFYDRTPVPLIPNWRRPPALPPKPVPVPSPCFLFPFNVARSLADILLVLQKQAAKMNIE